VLGHFSRSETADQLHHHVTCLDQSHFDLPLSSALPIKHTHLHDVLCVLHDVIHQMSCVCRPSEWDVVCVQAIRIGCADADVERVNCEY